MVRRLLICVVLCLTLAPAGMAIAAQDPLTVVAQPPGTTTPGPDVPTAPTVQDAQKSKNKLVLGVSAVVLLGIVILGHQARAKRRKKSEGG
jgi:hypothetical protein